VAAVEFWVGYSWILQIWRRSPFWVFLWSHWAQFHVYSKGSFLSPLTVHLICIFRTCLMSRGLITRNSYSMNTGTSLNPASVYNEFCEQEGNRKPVNECSRSRSDRFLHAVRRPDHSRVLIEPVNSASIVEVQENRCEWWARREWDTTIQSNSKVQSGPHSHFYFHNFPRTRISNVLKQVIAIYGFPGWNTSMLFIHNSCFYLE